MWNITKLIVTEIFAKWEILDYSKRSKMLQEKETEEKEDPTKHGTCK